MLCVLQIGQNWWLSVWSAATEAADAEHAHVATHYYLGVYFALGSVSLAFQFLRGLLLLYGSLRAAQRLHDGLVATVCCTKTTRDSADCIRLSAEREQFSAKSVLRTVNSPSELLHLALHDAMRILAVPCLTGTTLWQVLRLPMSFFDSQPAGRLLNRFSQDTESTDVVVRETIAWCLTCVGAMHLGFGIDAA